MKLVDYLSREGITKADLAKRLGVTRGAIQKWDEIPSNHMKVLTESRDPADVEIENAAEIPDGWEFLSRNWKVKGGKLSWQGGFFGHGSKWDYNYSPAKIFHIRKLLRQLGSVDAVYEWVHGVNFEKSFIEDVKNNIVCPIVVDMMKPRVEGGKPVPKRVYPFPVVDSSE